LFAEQLGKDEAAVPKVVYKQMSAQFRNDNSISNFLGMQMSDLVKKENNI
jgi:hypothetical protein